MKTKTIQATDMKLLEAGIVRFINATEGIEVINIGIATENTLDPCYPNIFHALIMYKIPVVDL